MKEAGKPEISYRRELRQNYLMIAADENLAERFEARMLAGNTIDGLLKFRVRREDDRLWFCYEITSRQPLSRLLERTAITAMQIRRLLLGIAQTLTRMEDYLLSENLILLDPEMIYMDPAEFQPGLCLMPGYEGNFPGEFSRFLQFLLSRTDHADKEAVMLVYGLYQESLKDNYGLGDLLRWLMKEEHSDPDAAYWGDNTETIPYGMRGTSEERQTWDRAEETDGYTVNSRAAKSSGSRKGWLVWWLFLPVLVLAALWLWRGTGGVLRYGPTVVFAAAAVSLVGITVCSLRSVRRGIRTGNSRLQESRDDRRGGHAQTEAPGGRPAAQKDTVSWEMVFEEPEAETELEQRKGKPPPSDAGGEGIHLREPPRPQPEDMTHTVLLHPAAPKAELRRLSGIAGTAETILISYYPFLIGKQDNLADYILKEDTISRLHARIDRRGDTYWLTDLNSTNGTVVNDHALQANETAELHIGDRVELADLQFKFE